MTWKYVVGDKYNLDELLGYEEFFKLDWLSAVESLNKAERYRKYGLPGFRLELIRRQMGVDEAVKNLDTVREAIVIARREEKDDQV
jgi:hypothetical protein